MKDALMNLSSWVLIVLLLPILLVQGLWVKLRTPILPEATGDSWGIVEGEGESLHLLVLGESTVAGVGVDTRDQAIACRTATAVGKTMARPVRWHAVGRIGMMVHQLRREYLGGVACLSPDLIMICVGVNDVLHLRSPKRYARELRGLIADLRELFGDIPVMIAGIAPLGLFPAIPQPLRYILGLRARVLDRAAGRLTRSLYRTSHCPTPAPADLIRALFAGDGFHPNTLGYALMSDLLGNCAVHCLRQDKT